jgi:hypothetical protein
MHGTIDKIDALWDDLPDEIQIVADQDLVDDWVWDGEILHLPPRLMRDMEAGETFAAARVPMWMLEGWEWN